jgi:putative PIN family toxin of toxin-antitoxin system
MYRVVIDPNLWISFLIGKKLESLEGLFSDENVAIISSPKIIEEYLDVSSRPKIKKYVDEGRILHVFDLIKLYCVDDPGFNIDVPELTDPKDLYLLALAKANDADFLLTGDKGLWALGKFYQTEIISFSSFMAILGKLEGSEI